jgi:hypothetical protein
VGHGSAAIHDDPLAVFFTLDARLGETGVTRSNSEVMCSVSNTWMSTAFTSSSPSMMARCSFWTSFLAAVVLAGVEVMQCGLQ